MNDKNPLALLPGLWKKSTVLLFNTCNQIVNDRLAEDMKRDGIDISPRAGWILMAADEKTLSQSVIAEALNINTNVMVRLLDDLEEKGFIRRIPGPRRRENSLQVTHAGKDLLKKMYTGWDARTEKIFHPIPIKFVRMYTQLARGVIKEQYSTKKKGPTRRISLW